MNISLETASKLLQIKAIILNPQKPFTWSSGLKSPIYCDNRILLSYPTIRKRVVEDLAKISSNFDTFDTIAGVATAGIPHGVLLANLLELPFVYIRSKPKAHGRQNLIEGHLRPNSRVLVVEDLISTGGSALKAVNALKQEGVSVVGVLAIFTYGFSQSKQAFAEEGCPLFTLSDYSTLIEAAVQEKYVDESSEELLREWIVNPEGWSQKQ